MKEKMLYVCEICHTEYAKQSDAEACESSHKTKLKITDCRYLSYRSSHSGFPVSIKVTDKDTGETVVYKR